MDCLDPVTTSPNLCYTKCMKTSKKNLYVDKTLRMNPITARVRPWVMSRSVVFWICGLYAHACPQSSNGTVYLSVLFKKEFVTFVQIWNGFYWKSKALWLCLFLKKKEKTRQKRWKQIHINSDKITAKKSLNSTRMAILISRPPAFHSCNPAIYRQTTAFVLLYIIFLRYNMEIS